MSDLPREPLSTGSDVFPPPTAGSEFPSSSEGSSSSTSSGTGSKVDTAKGEAKQVADTAMGSGKEVAATAKEEVKNVAAETKQQAVSLLDTVRTEAGQQISTSQNRIADAVHGLAKELGSMASSSEESGPLTDLAQQASHKGGEIAHWLQEREPSDVLEEVRTYARRRPGTFLVLCGLAGVVAGRLTRSAVASRTSLDSKTGTDSTAGRSSLGSGYPATSYGSNGVGADYATAPVGEPVSQTSGAPSAGVYGGTVESTQPATGTGYVSDPPLPGSGYVGTTGTLGDPDAGPTR